MVLEAQVTVKSKNPGCNIRLILPEELHEIRRLWRIKESDWEDSLPRIFREVNGADLEWLQDDVSFSAKEKSLLLEICNAHGLPFGLATKILDVAIQSKGMTRRASIYKKINRIFSEEWRTEEELVGGMKAKAAVQGGPA
jgi:DNA sulfur modification protein DndC